MICTRRSERFLLRMLFCVLVPRPSIFIWTGASMIRARFDLLYVVLLLRTYSSGFKRKSSSSRSKSEREWPRIRRYIIITRHLPHT